MHCRRLSIEHTSWYTGRAAERVGGKMQTLRVCVAEVVCVCGWIWWSRWRGGFPLRNHLLFFFLSIFLHAQTSIDITMNLDFLHAASLIKGGRKEGPFHYMTVINGRVALNELQADWGNWKCRHKASPETNPDTRTPFWATSFACKSELFGAAAQEWAARVDSHMITLVWVVTHNHFHVLKMTKYMLNWYHTEKSTAEKEETPCNYMQQLNSLRIVSHALLLAAPCSCGQSHI